MAQFHTKAREGTMKNIKGTMLSAGRVDYIDFDTKAAAPTGSPAGSPPPGAEDGNGKAAASRLFEEEKPDEEAVLQLSKAQKDEEDRTLAMGIAASMAGSGGDSPQRKEKVDVDTLD